MDLIPALHAAATLSMAGLIWFVQVVHYPLMARVPAEVFQSYEAEHVRRTTYVVAPLMLVELATAGWLWFVLDAQRGLQLAAIALLGVAWLSTALIQVPCHRRLEQGLDLAVVQRLVQTNWIRTAAWTSRGILACLIAR